MGIFGTSSPFDQCVDKATSEKNVGDDWGQIMDICDKVKESSNGPKDCMKSISKRLNNDNPRVALQTITLLDACVNNCGKKFLLEVAARDFEQELHKLTTGTKTHPKVSSRLRESLKKWAEGEFKGDTELSLIPALYNKLLKDGYEFDSQQETTKKVVKYSDDPNVVNNQQEEEDIAKAIQLSLQDSGSSTYKGLQGPRDNASSGGLYSSATAALNATPSSPPENVEKEPLKVRALYDFEAAEDNELTFKSGEIIIVTDNSDTNWWKGTNHRGEGLFPSNFVTKSLEKDVEHIHKSDSSKKVSFSECVEVTEVEDIPSEIVEEVSGEINEDKIDQLLHLLHEADPTGERLDDPSLPLLEEHVNAMAPNIDVELERIDKKHAQLARLSTDLVDALNLYHQLMREMPSSMPYYSQYNKGMPQGSQMPPGMMPPPPYMQFNPIDMQQQAMYPPGQMTPNYVGLPPYMPPGQGPLGPGGQFPQHLQQMPPTSHIGGNCPPSYNQYPHGNPDFNRPSEPISASPRNMPTNSQGAPINLPPQVSTTHMAQHGPPGNFGPQGPPSEMQSHMLPPNMPQMALQHGGHPSMNLPQQVNMPPMSIHSQVPSSMPSQGHPSNMPYYPPSSYPQPTHPQSMQQPLL